MKFEINCKIGKKTYSLSDGMHSFSSSNKFNILYSLLKKSYVSNSSEIKVVSKTTPLVKFNFPGNGVITKVTPIESLMNRSTGTQNTDNSKDNRSVFTRSLVGGYKFSAYECEMEDKTTKYVGTYSQASFEKHVFFLANSKVDLESIVDTVLNSSCSLIQFVFTLDSESIIFSQNNPIDFRLVNDHLFNSFDFLNVQEQNIQKGSRLYDITQIQHTKMDMNSDLSKQPRFQETILIECIRLYRNMSEQNSIDVAAKQAASDVDSFVEKSKNKVKMDAKTLIQNLDKAQPINNPTDHLKPALHDYFVSHLTSKHAILKFKNKKIILDRCEHANMVNKHFVKMYLVQCGFAKQDGIRSIPKSIESKILKQQWKFILDGKTYDVENREVKYTSINNPYQEICFLSGLRFHYRVFNVKVGSSSDTLNIQNNSELMNILEIYEHTSEVRHFYLSDSRLSLSNIDADLFPDSINVLFSFRAISSESESYPTVISLKILPNSDFVEMKTDDNFILLNDVSKSNLAVSSSHLNEDKDFDLKNTTVIDSQGKSITISKEVANRIINLLNNINISIGHVLTAELDSTTTINEIDNLFKQVDKIKTESEGIYEWFTQELWGNNYEEQKQEVISIMDNFESAKEDEQDLQFKKLFKKMNDFFVNYLNIETIVLSLEQSVSSSRLYQFKKTQEDFIKATESSKSRKSGNEASTKILKTLQVLNRDSKNKTNGDAFIDFINEQFSV